MEVMLFGRRPDDPDEKNRLFVRTIKSIGLVDLGACEGADVIFAKRNPGGSVTQGLKRLRPGTGPGTDKPIPDCATARTELASIIALYAREQSIPFTDAARVVLADPEIKRAYAAVIRGDLG